MPCHPARARQLLKSGRARVYKFYPFVIRLKDISGGATQPVVLKIDPGAVTTGLALNRQNVTDATNQTVLHLAELDIERLRQTVERLRGGTATLAQFVPVRETFQGQTAWEGVVHVFDLAGHPKATRAYTWSSPKEGSVKRPFSAMLRTELINSSIEAVRAAIVAEHRARS